MPSGYHHRHGVRFSDDQPDAPSAYEPSNFRPTADEAYTRYHKGNNGAPPHKSRSLRAPAPHSIAGTINFTLAPPLGPLAHRSEYHLTPRQSATQPAMGSLMLQLPRPFAPMRISPAGADMHVTVHDVWSAARRFYHMAASRDDLEALSEVDRRRVKEAYFQRVRSNKTPDDGLRRGDFLCGAVIAGFVPVADTPKATIAFSLGKAP